MDTSRQMSSYTIEQSISDPDTMTVQAIHSHASTYEATGRGLETQSCSDNPPYVTSMLCSPSCRDARIADTVY